jgi:3-methyladenine DNA glycosylase/8-oxoguanine DNA glycosylase
MRKRRPSFRRFSIIVGSWSWIHRRAGAHATRQSLFSGDKAKAKAAYEAFLALWKDADPDLPTLKRAKAEYESDAIAP